MTKMRIAALLLIISFIVSCQNNDDINDQSKRNENWAWFIDKTTGQGQWVPLSDETTVDEGQYQLFYCNGNLRQKGKLKNGIDCDTIFYFDINGKPLWKSIQLPDSSTFNIWPDGSFEAHYPTCELKVEGKRLNNQLIDTCIDYFRNGRIRMYGIYRNDTSWIKHYHENGQISHKGMKFADLSEGADTLWYKDGTLKEVRFYVKGKRHGESKLYYPSGNLWEVMNYDRGVQDGSFIQFHENGRVDQKFCMVNGQREGVYVQYYANENLYLKGALKSGKKNGIWVAHYPDGRIAATTNYLNDIMHGRRECFSSSGHLFYVQDYRNGEEVYSNEVRQLTDTEQERWKELTAYIKMISQRDRERVRD
jgi:antitoxin component YwqK of YwqJK toxin-antitoxin module